MSMALRQHPQLIDNMVQKQNDFGVGNRPYPYLICRSGVMTRHACCADISQIRSFFFADIGCKGAARMKRTTRRGIDGIGDFPFWRFDLTPDVVHTRGGIQQHLRIRVFGL